MHSVDRMELMTLHEKEAIVDVSLVSHLNLNVNHLSKIRAIYFRSEIDLTFITITGNPLERGEDLKDYFV